MRIAEITLPANSRAKRGQRNPGNLTYSQPTQKYLYHGTSLANLGLIWMTNRLEEGGYWGKQNEPFGPRCSRDINIAKSFAFEQELPWGGILVLDWPKLAQRYKIVTYTDTSYEGEPWPEQEEAVLAKQISPLSDYLVEIRVNTGLTQKVIDWTNQYIEAYWVRHPSPKRVAMALQSLYASKLVRISR